MCFASIPSPYNQTLGGFAPLGRDFYAAFAGAPGRLDVLWSRPAAGFPTAATSEEGPTARSDWFRPERCNAGAKTRAVACGQRAACERPAAAKPGQGALLASRRTVLTKERRGRSRVFREKNRNQFVMVRVDPSGVRCLVLPGRFCST